jgi:heterotetrameric sarcosine oxidase gamma subunit
MQLQAQAPLGALLGVRTPVVGFAAENAALSVRSDIGCVLLTTAVDDAEISMAAGAAAGIDLPTGPGMIGTRAGRAALWLSPRSWLIRCGVEEELKLVARVNASVRDKLAHAVGYTDALCWFELSGPGSADLLAAGAFVSLERSGLPVGHAKRTLVAQIAVVIVRESESVWLLAVERSRGRYFADWLAASL